MKATAMSEIEDPEELENAEDFARLQRQLDAARRLLDLFVADYGNNMEKGDVSRAIIRVFAATVQKARNWLALEAPPSAPPVPPESTGPFDCPFYLRGEACGHKTHGPYFGTVAPPGEPPKRS